MRFKFAIAVILLASSTAFLGAADDFPAELYSRVQDTAVEILLDGVHSGSGNFVSADGLILSAAHIFKGRSGDERLEVISERFGRLPAERLELSPAYDLALLKVEKGSGDYPFLRAAGELPPVGSKLYLLASPSYIHSVLNSGSVALDRIEYRDGEYTGCQGYAEVLYVSTATDRGSSGGGWFDGAGRLIGVQSGWVNRLGGGDDSADICMVSPPAATARFIAGRRPEQLAWLGGIIEEIWTQPQGFVARFPAGVSGLVVHQIKPGGPLEAAGVEREHLITALDGEAVDYRHRFMDLIRAKRPGDEIVLTLMSPDQHEVLEKKIVLGAVE